MRNSYRCEVEVYWQLSQKLSIVHMLCRTEKSPCFEKYNAAPCMFHVVKQVFVGGNVQVQGLLQNIQIFKFQNSKFQTQKSSNNSP
jgi:hypothetical protein